MTGSVDDAGRALVRIRLKNPANAMEAELDAWIDTGFTGELVLPRHTVASLGLPLGPTVKARLADGSEIQLDTHTCLLNGSMSESGSKWSPTRDNTHCLAWACSWIATCTLIIEPRKSSSVDAGRGGLRG